MRVVHITQTISRAGGGVAKYVADLSGWMATQGYETEVMAIEDSYGADEAFWAKHPIQPTLLKRRAPGFIGRSDLANRLHHTKKPAILHIHGMRCLQNHAATVWAKNNGIPIVLSPHAQLMPFNMGQRRARKMIYDFIIEKRDMRHVSVLHAVSKLEADRVPEAWRACTPVSVVPIGLDVKSWRAYPSSPIAHLANKKPFVTFFGILSWRKGLDILLDAWSIMGDTAAGWNLVIAGGDPDGLAPVLRTRCVELGIERGVKVLPNVSRAEARWLLENSSLYVLPSRAESFAISVIEAMALGVPVVATKDSSWTNLDALAVGATCNTNPRSVADAIGSMLRLPLEQLTVMGERACSLVEREYSWDRCGAAMMDTYAAVVRDQLSNISATETG